jgi:hypothetical protein
MLTLWANARDLGLNSECKAEEARAFKVSNKDSSSSLEDCAPNISATVLTWAAGSTTSLAECEDGRAWAVAGRLRAGSECSAESRTTEDGARVRADDGRGGKEEEDTAFAETGNCETTKNRMTAQVGKALSSHSAPAHQLYDQQPTLTQACHRKLQWKSCQHELEMQARDSLHRRHCRILGVWQHYPQHFRSTVLQGRPIGVCAESMSESGCGRCKTWKALAIPLREEPQAPQENWATCPEAAVRERSLGFTGTIPQCLK